MGDMIDDLIDIIETCPTMTPIQSMIKVIGVGGAQIRDLKTSCLLEFWNVCRIFFETTVKRFMWPIWMRRPTKYSMQCS